MRKPKKVYVVHINGKTLNTIKAVIFIDVLLGTGIYVAAKFVTSSILLASIGSMAGSEGYKWRLRRLKKRVVTIPKNKWPSNRALAPESAISPKLIRGLRIT